MATAIDENGQVIYIPENRFEAGMRGAVQGAQESVPGRIASSVLGGLGHLLGAPSRAVAAVGQNMTGTGQRLSPVDAAVYGRDMNTGQAPAGYGTLLSKVAFGEDAPRSGMALLTEDIGNMVGDPVMLGAGASALSKLSGTAIAGDVGVKAQERALVEMGPKLEGAVSSPVFKPRRMYAGDAPSTLLDTDLTTGQHAGRHIGVRDFNRQLGQWARKASK